MTKSADYPAWDGVHPLDWYRLIGEAETIRARNGLGPLSEVWRHIDARHYHTARAALDLVVDEISHGYRGPHTTERTTP